MPSLLDGILTTELSFQGQMHIKPVSGHTNLQWQHCIRHLPVPSTGKVMTEVHIRTLEGWQGKLWCLLQKCWSHADLDWERTSSFLVRCARSLPSWKNAQTARLGSSHQLESLFWKFARLLHLCWGLSSIMRRLIAVYEVVGPSSWSSDNLIYRMIP